VLGIFLASVPGTMSLGLLTLPGGTFFPYWSSEGVVPPGLGSIGFPGSPSMEGSSSHAWPSLSASRRYGSLVGL
jgi:hypothetical protein